MESQFFVWEQILACYLEHTRREEVEWVGLGDMYLVHVPSSMLPIYNLTLVFKYSRYKFHFTDKETVLGKLKYLAQGCGNS